ncbi:hypothetical protein H6G81_18575 [Scytonema hofmannii FACHB-248]|uniref:Uncharacterized protein n=1 Tax=Scytonema hofmannii FACHB-248 TaxID=1842502 RepID=A0ABR8GSQ2_9CYAN|nr:MULTISPECIES: hypothetical protein [Nostocales]MBD2606480.1 hypothetical protein [Scytonema hofmannii FACHB-248]
MCEGYNKKREEINRCCDRTPAPTDKNSRFFDIMRTTYVAQASHRTYQIYFIIGDNADINTVKAIAPVIPIPQKPLEHLISERSSQVLW